MCSTAKTREETLVKNFRDLKVWQKAHQLVLAIYPASKDFPREEVYGETSQMLRRAPHDPDPAFSSRVAWHGRTVEIG